MRDIAEQKNKILLPSPIWKEEAEVKINGAPLINIKNDLAKGYFMTMVIAVRNSGKTYSAVEAIQDMVRSGFDPLHGCRFRFLYLRRRWDNELKYAKDSLFADHDDLHFYCKGKEYYYVYNGKSYPCGQCAPLSTLKSRGIQVPHLKLIFFDEFTAKPGETYLPGEFITYAGAIETLVRVKTDVRILLCGNAGRFYNPYTINYNINLVEGQYKYTLPENGVHLHIYGKEYARLRNESPVGKLFKGTAYDAWAGSVDWEEENWANIEPRPRRSRDICSIRYYNDTFLISATDEGQKIYVQIGSRMECHHYTFDTQNVSENALYFGRKNPIMNLFRNLFGVGRVYFVNRKTASLFLPILDFIKAMA